MMADISDLGQYFPKIKVFKSNDDFSKFIKKNNIKLIEIYKEVLYEYFLNTQPSIYFSSQANQDEKFKKYYLKLLQKNDFYQLGNWVYHPWNGDLIHLLRHDDFLDVRTIRNRNIVTKDEQFSLYNKSIAIAGLSVGLNTILSLVRLGIGNWYKIADIDKVSITNINRTPYILSDRGKSKVSVVISNIHKIDPFIKISAFTKGLTEAVLEEFIADVDLIIDTFDDFDLKIKIRKLAKEKKIPVIACFDIERSVLLIIERYDQDENLNFDFFLNGYSEEEIKKASNKTELFINIIGKKYHSKKMLQSVLSVGKILTGYPQLITASQFASSLLSVVVEQIFTGEQLPSSRKYFSLTEMINR